METVTLWSHALAALMFGGVAVWAARIDLRGLPRWPLVGAAATVAVWAVSVAGLGHEQPATRLAEGLRGLALLGLGLALHRRSAQTAPAGVFAVHGVVAAVVVLGALLALAATGMSDVAWRVEIAHGAALLRMMAAVAALIVVQNLYATSPRSDVRLICIAVALLWAAQLGIATTTYLGIDAIDGMRALRGLFAMAGAGLFALALQRGNRGAVQVSRMVAYRSLSLLAVAAYFALLGVVTSALSALGGDHARVLQTAFAIGSTVAMLTLFGSSWLRAWVRVKIAKHLFRHRYDYRAEWIRFTGTLGAPEQAAPLEQRIVRALGEMTESPAGLLLVPDGDALGIGAGWNWPELPRSGAGAAFAALLAQSDRIVELDPLRRGAGDPAERAVVPQWMLDDADGWAVVPLPHLGRLVGAILLARPTVDRALDWEDFDLLRIAGRQVASHLAEARAQDALAQNERFDEFNRRFAFIVHDIKNLVSGLTLVARNAERHADNPEFRADMVATLQDSATKLTALLARLSAADRAPSEPAAPVGLLALAQRVASLNRASHAVEVEGDAHTTAFADASAVEQVASHLVRNAIEASPADAPVTILVEDRGADVTITVVDRGAGMSPGFVRDQLFRPFVSSKPAGFGIGAYEARQLVAAMGGRVEVDSREGEGTRFRVILPAANADRRAAA